METEPAVVLVVDDERELADMYASWLADDYIVRTAYTGTEALESLDELPDVVLLDRNIPDISGREILREIRNRELFCKVAMVTAVKPDLDIIDMGFDDYLVKPVFSSDIHNTITRLLQRRKLDKEQQILFALASKKAVLEDEKDAIELAESSRYRELIDEFKIHRSKVEDMFPEFAEENYESLFYDLQNGPIKP